MSTLVFTLIRLGFLALIWLFVFSVIFTLRRDVYGTELRDRRSSARPSTRKEAKRSPRKTPPPSARPEPPSRPQALYLTVTDGPLAGTSLPLGNAQIVVGRSPDSALVLDDSYSSSRHARFFINNGQWWIEDLDSTNGTFLGGQRITSPRPVEPGTPITIGHTTMEIR